MILLSKSVRQRIKEAQGFKQYKIKSMYHDRIPYGRESWFDPKYEECPVCYCYLGQRHTLGCSNESAVCMTHTHAIKCDCDIEKGIAV